MLRHKLIIFFIFIILHLVKIESKYDFYTSLSPKSNIVYQTNVTPKQTIFIPTMTTIAPRATTTPVDWYDMEFKLSNVGLRKIGEEFINSNELIIKLRLDNNEINSISSYAFHKMPNLRYLDLSGNKIPKEKMLSFVGNNKLQTLLINNNNDNRNVEELNDYGPLKSLKNLSLCNSQLKNLQVPYYRLTPNLNYLQLSNNSISSGHVVFDNIPQTLTHLRVDDNSIDRVEPDKLRYLFLFAFNCSFSFTV